MDPRRDEEPLPYLGQNARVNAAAAATLALAPPPPAVTNDRGQPSITRAPSGYDANLTWKAAPGASAYRIFFVAAYVSPPRGDSAVKTKGQ